MDYLVTCASALAVAGLTLFSGFGLSTLLMPVFAVFFPVEIAVAATAVVHLLNNVFKLALVGRHAKRRVVLRFGIPAVLAAFAGAALLRGLSALEPVATWTLAGRSCEVTVIKLVIAALILAFSLFDLVPRLRIAVDRKYLPLGGALSGFFGGLSGHQGALRSAFLIKLGLTTQQFIGTGVVVSVMVDVSRLLVYGSRFAAEGFGDGGMPPRLIGLVGAATASAFVGSFFGARLMQKVTIEALRIAIAVGLVLLAAALAAGVV